MPSTRSSTTLYLLILLSLLASLPTSAQAGRAESRSNQEPPPVPEKTSTEMYDDWHLPLNLERQAPLSTPQVDHFGYTLDDTGAIAWMDATSGTELFDQPQDDRDDGYSQEIPIGFEFKFYEQVYTSLSISTNGFVTFGGGSDSFSNRILPHNTPPNNILAAFWDDLHVGSGGVYYLQTDCGGVACFVIAWNQVVRLGNLDKLTFEIVLFQNGDILFQYLDLNGNLGDATVGIEDGDGVDGLLYLYNAPGLSSGLVLRFDRPPAGPRVKLLPPYQGGFAFKGEASFPIQVRNTNESGKDTIDISLAASKPGWQLDFYAADRRTPLSDSDGDGQPDTGSLPHGDTRTVILKVKAPESAKIGDYLKINITVNSSEDLSKSATGEIQVAIPATFAQAYSDSQTGVYLDMVFHKAEYASRIYSFFTGNTMSVAGEEQGGYVFAYEQNGSTGGDQPAYYSDIYYALLDRFGVETRPLDALTDNSTKATPELVVNARYPSIAVAPDGKIGILWAHYQLDVPNARTNSNIYFAILNLSGKLLFGPYNVTQNSAWREPGAEDVPVFSSPRLVATADNRFFLTWMDSHDAGGGEQSGIYYAIFNSSSAVVKPTTLFVESSPGVTYFIDPALAELVDNRVLLAYSIYTQAQPSYVVAFAILRSNGNTLRNAEIIAGSSGWRTDAVQLKSDKVMLAWTDPTNDQISYTMLNGNDYHVINGPNRLAVLGGRIPDYVSVATDESGKGILTWMDAEWKDYLYYALVGSDGKLLSPAMVFAAGQAANPLIQTSFSGQGVASYKGAARVFLPTIRR